MTTETLGKYNLVRHLATGGMAEIWLAEAQGPGGFNKEMVLKRILPHLARDQHFTQMFLDEARLVAQLTHPNIAQIYELGEVDGSYFIAMEFVDGLDLAKLLEAARDLDREVPIELSVRIIRDVLQALDFAHEFSGKDGELAGIIHRDISPQNVLVSNDGIVKLVDFGVAKAAANKSKTEDGAVKGKFAYMAPEQIEGKVLDRRVDIFAVGCVLYELLTGVKPFGEDLMAVAQILKGEFKDPRELRGQLPDKLVEIIYTALGSQPDDRYPTGEAMFRDVERVLYASENVAGPRELATFVRQLRGLPTPRPTPRSIRAAVPELTPPALKATPDPTPAVSPEPAPEAAPQPTAEVGLDMVKEPKLTPRSESNPAELQVGARVTPLEPETTVATPREGPGPTWTGPAAEEAPPEKSSTGLIVGFVLLMICIVGAAIVAGFLYIQSGDPPETPPVVVTQPVAPVTQPVVETVQPVAKKVEPVKTSVKKVVKEPVVVPDPVKQLQHVDGLLVYISTKPPAKIFHEGERIGDTPYQTSLRPGTYEFTLEAGKKKRTVPVKVETGRTIQRFNFDL